MNLQVKVRRKMALLTRLAAAAAAAALLTGPAEAAGDAEKRAVLATYADIAHAVYEDSLIAAKGLLDAVKALLDNPSEGTLAAAREAWLAARVP